MRGLTQRQRQTLQFIEHYLDLHGFAPTVREVASHLGVTTKGAHDHLRALQRKGCITRGSRRSRAIAVTGNGSEAPEVVDIPVLGTVMAGQPCSPRKTWTAPTSCRGPASARGTTSRCTCAATACRTQASMTATWP